MKYPKTINLILRIIFLIAATGIAFTMPSVATFWAVYAPSLLIYETWVILCLRKYGV